VVLTAIPGYDSEGRADDVVPGRFDVEQERGTSVEEVQGTSVEEHAYDVEEGTRWRQMLRRSGHQRVCGREMKGLGFRGSGTHENKNSSNQHDDIIKVHRCK
jgi:hypothetical protein